MGLSPLFLIPIPAYSSFLENGGNRSDVSFFLFKYEFLFFLLHVTPCFYVPLQYADSRYQRKSIKSVRYEMSPSNVYALCFFTVHNEIGMASMDREVRYHQRGFSIHSVGFV